MGEELLGVPIGGQTSIVVEVVKRIDSLVVGKQVPYGCDVAFHHEGKMQGRITLYQVTRTSQFVDGAIVVTLNPRFNPMPTRTPTLEDLKSVHDVLCGLGGFTSAFSVLGIQTISAVDSSPLAASVFSLNHTAPCLCKDVTDVNTVYQMHALQLESGKQPFLSAGIPCQPLSQQGHQRGALDSRSATLPAVLETAVLLQSSGLLLECVPEARTDPFVQGCLSDFCQKHGFTICQRVLHLHHIWPSKRSRWFAVLVPVSFGYGSFLDLPCLDRAPVVGDLFPYECWPVWNSEEENQLRWTDMETSAFRDSRFGNTDRTIKRNEPMPTALHSWGSVLMECPCGCRSSGISVHSLLRKGLRGVEVKSAAWPYFSRHVHPKELQLLLGFSPLQETHESCRAQLCLQGNAVSPIQALWVWSNVLRNLGVSASTQSPSDVLGRYTLDLLHQRDVTWPSPSPGTGTLSLIVDDVPTEVSFHTLQQVDQLKLAETSLRLDGTNVELWCEGILLPAWAYLQERTYHLTWTCGPVHDLTPVPVFVDFLGVRSCHVVPASLSFGTLLSFCGIHDFLALTDGHGSSLVSTDQVKAWGVVVVHLSPEDLEFELALRLDGFGSFDFHGLCTTPSWESTGFWIFDQIAKSQALVTWAGSNFAPLAIWLPSFTEAVLDLWPGIIDGVLSDWLARPNATIYAIVWEPWGWNLIKLQLDPFFLCATHFVSASDLPSQASYLVARAFHVSIRIRCVETYQDTQADAPIGTLKRVFQILDLDLGLPSCLCDSLCAISVPDPCRRNTEGLYVSPTLSWTSCFEDPDQMPLSPTGGPASPQGLPAGFILDFARALVSSAPMTITADQINVIVPQEDPSSCGFLTRDFVPHSQPIFLFFLCNKHWTFLHCTLHESELHIVQFDGLGLTPLCKIRPVADLLKKHWNVQSVILSNKFVAQQSRSDSCGTLALAHFAYALDLISLEQIDHFEKLHDSFVLSSRCRFQVGPIGFGKDADAITKTLEKILHEKGVPQSELANRIQSAIKAFGVSAIAKALDAKTPWPALKTLGNSRPKPFLWVSHQELQAHIQERSRKEYGVDIKKPRKNKENKQAESSLLDSAALTLPADLFVTNSGQSLQQLSLAQVQKDACGVAFATAAEAAPFLAQGKLISPEGLSLLVIGSLAGYQSALPMNSLRVPAIYKGTNEPVLVDVTTVQLGDMAVYRKTCDDTPEVTVHPNVVVRAHVFRDLWSDNQDWIEFTAHPIRHIVDAFPVLQLCREEECTNCPKYHPSIEESGIESGLLDVWGFRWTKYDGSKSKPADSEVLSVYLRIPESSFNVLHCASGIFGTFFEPRGQDNPGPDTRYSVVWAPKLSLGEAQHLVKTDDACIAVCRLGHKIGLRCWAKNYESLHQQVCPEKPFVNCNVKTVYRIEPLPAGTQRQSLVDILKSFKWIAKPLAPCRGSQGRAWQIGSETSPPCAFLETKSGWVSITKVKDQGVPAKTTDLIATARTRQHIQGQTNASASSSSTSDPWTVGHDPWGGYAGVGKSAIAPPSQHVQSKFDDVEQRLQSQVTESIAKGLEQIQSEPSNRMQTVEAQLQALAQQQHYLDNRLTADSAKIQEIQSNCSELAAAVQTCTTTLADQGTALQSIATEVSTQGRSLKQVSSEVASVSQNLTSQLDSYFSRQSEQIEALLAKRQRSTWLAPRGPLFGLARAPRAHANCPWIFRLILVWLFTCFLRVGEAAVPGPPDVEDPPVWALPGQPSFSISIGNPGGLCNKLHHLQSYPEGWHHFAETHCSASQLHHVQAHLRAVSVQSGRLLRSTSGAPAPLRAGSSFAGSWTGVLAFGDCPLRNIPLDWPSDLYKSGRVMVSSAFVNGLELIAGTVYCPPRGPTHPRAREQSEELLRPLTENIVLGRSGPRFILGDMNCPAGSLNQMKLWESLGWVELQSFMQDRFQVTPQPTCKSSTSPDQVWLSPEATLLVANSSVWHVYADHSVVLAGLSLPRVSINEPQWWLPGHVPWEHITQDLWTHESDIGLMFPTTLVPVGGSDLSSSDVAAEGQLEASKAFHCWSQKFEKRVNRCASTHIAQHDRSFHGRGSMTAPRQRKKCPPVQKSSRPGEVSQLNGFLNRAVGRWFRQLRRLQSYKHAAGSVNAETNFESRIALWHSIRTAPGFQGGFDSWWLTRPVQSQGVPTTLPITAPNHRVAVLLYDEFLLNYRKFELWQLSRRNESCKHKLQSSVRGLFAATRKPAKEALDCLEDSLSQEITVVDTADNLVAVPHPFPPNNLFAWTLQQQPVQVRPMNGLYQIDTDLVLCSGQTLSCQVLVHETTEIHQRLANLWSPRWNRHHEIPLHRWDEIVDFAEAHLPRAELTLPAITAQDWHRAVGAFKSNAATGPCGWTLADLKNLTPTQVEAVLDAFQKIEEGAPWPLQWNVGLVHCLQKKADRHSVSGFRPITVMSLFYRIWAGIRSGQILAFLAGLSDTYQTGFLQHRQSVDIWYFVNICLEVSMQQDWPVHGVVADLVAAYNLLPRHPAFRFLQILGVPRWFIQVWSRHLETFQRFFVVRRHAGPSLGSCTGFAEGCPLSCSAMTAFDCAWHVFQRHTSLGIVVWPSSWLGRCRCWAWTLLPVAWLADWSF